MAPASPYTGKVLKEKADSWHHGVNPSSHQAWLDLLLTTLKNLADAGLGMASVLVNLHHWRIVPLMERRLCIFEMDEEADPVALAQSRLLPDPFPQEYAATRARRAINLRAVKHSHDDHCSFVMLSYGPLVSGFLPPFSLFICKAPAWLEFSFIPCR
jgi:hypothetical protein